MFYVYSVLVLSFDVFDGLEVLELLQLLGCGILKHIASFGIYIV